MSANRVPTARDEILAMMSATGARSRDIANAAGIPHERLRSLLSGDRESLPIADLVSLRDVLKARLSEQCAGQAAG
jgi:hypothetical protein